MTAPANVRIIQGDCRAVLSRMEPDSIDCVVTSPPYWGLRDYGTTNQLGLERTLGDHLDVMVGLFHDIHRVLKPEGTVWLNYGDCYATKPCGRSAAAIKALGADDRTFRDKPFATVGPVYDPHGGAKGGGDRGTNKGNAHAPSGRIVAGGNLKTKDLCMVSNRLAIALQAAGWWVRSEIIWGKPNPMPESVRDRPATAHEKIWLLSKSARYWYDPIAARQPSNGDEVANGFRGGSYVGGEPGPRQRTGNHRPEGGPTYWQPNEPDAIKSPYGQGFTRRAKRGQPPRHAQYESGHQTLDQTPRGLTRNLRNWEPPAMQVWQMATRPFRDAHFATFPPELVERCLAAGCPPGGTVLDPFGGAGTVGLVAAAMMREAILIELSPEYCRMAANRLRAGLIRVDGVAHDDPGPLFAQEPQ